MSTDLERAPGLMADSDEALAELIGDRTVERFLVRECELLDNNQLEEWLEALEPAISYRAPVRVTRERKAGPGFSATSWHFLEDHDSLTTRGMGLVPDLEGRAPQADREKVYQAGIGTSSAGGIFEQDDAEPRQSIARGARSTVAHTHEFQLTYQMGMDVSPSARFEPGWPGPGVAFRPRYEEDVQPSLYRRWLDERGLPRAAPREYPGWAGRRAGRTAGRACLIRHTGRPARKYRSATSSPSSGSGRL